MHETECKSSRREFSRTGAGAMGAIAFSSALPQGAAAPRPAPARPNFIFVTTDGHRPDALSFNGNRILQTPNIDRIGREGIQFQNSFVVNALCLPSPAAAGSVNGLALSCEESSSWRFSPASSPINLSAEG